MKTLVPNSSLTGSEKLVLWRRRNGLNQTQAARKLKTSLNQLALWETGGEKVPKVGALGKLTPGEQCFILRRRSGKQQKDIAAELGICRYWLMRMEQGLANADALVKYWS